MKTVILGLDAFDPRIFEKLADQNDLPYLKKYLKGGYSRFTVTNPPQSEVSWTSIASGMDPGGHGVFDFVHRDPQTYQPFVSLLPTKKGLGGIQFTYPHNANTIFQQAAQMGFPATALWWPATFPARIESPVRTIPGLGAPDIQGRLGVGSVFTTTSGSDQTNLKTPVNLLRSENRFRFTGQLSGPSQQGRQGLQEAKLEFRLELAEGNQARFYAGQHAIDLEIGKWSPILEFDFKVSFLYSVRAVTRVILTRVKPDIILYFLPLQIHPLKSPWRYATPPEFVSDTWKNSGPFLTLGWPQDTTGLEEGWIDETQFLDLCELIETERERVLNHHMKKFKEGVFAVVFDSLDRIQHMFWRDRQDIIINWYRRLDQLAARLDQTISRSYAPEARFLIVSDHGFSRFDYKINLNRWLIERGYLKTTAGGEKGSLKDVDWCRSQAYALGLNSLYLNLAGREGQGSVQPAEAAGLSARLCAELAAWRGPDGKPVVANPYPNQFVFTGPLSEFGPDIVVGYSSGYRASQSTGLGAWEENSVEANIDHWGADHCIDASEVPGIIFTNQGLKNFSQPSFRDFPALAIDMQLDDQGPARPVQSSSDEDQDALEERMKSLGYL